MDWARFCWAGPWGEGGDPRPPSGAKAAGLAYERKVHRRFLTSFAGGASDGPLYCPAQWIEFRANGSPRHRWAQPDGLLVHVNLGLVVIVEAKLKHTIRSWWWTRKLYDPLLRRLFPPGWSFAWLEVCRYFEPGVEWPEPLRMVKDPASLREGQFGCHIWSGAADAR